MMSEIEIEEWTEEEILQLQEKLEEAMRVSIEYKERHDCDP